MTYGEVLDELPEQYIHMYQRLFPPLPVAGRPLDIWENDPYLLWGMNPGEADGPYVLFGVFDVLGDGQRHVRLNLDEVAARCRGWGKPVTVPKNYLLWDFWEETLTESQGEKLELPLRAKSCYLFALRPKLGRPQLLGATGHFSQGVIETQDVAWNATAKQLQGNVRGNGGDPTTLFFHVPETMQPAGRNPRWHRSNDRTAGPRCRGPRRACVGRTCTVRPDVFRHPHRTTITAICSRSCRNAIRSVTEMTRRESQWLRHPLQRMMPVAGRLPRSLPPKGYTPWAMQQHSASF